ncbi:MAG: hypothetical protein AAB403_24480 [Planctomycetota bacterium]
MKSVGPMRQVHVRVSAEMKRTVKIFCLRAGTTEQSWIHGLIEGELRRKAPDLWASGGKDGPELEKPKGRQVVHRIKP